MDDDQLWGLLTLGTAVAALLLMFFYNRSFVPAQFLVLSKQWESTTELVHDETETDYVCNRDGDCKWVSETETVVDESVTLSGQGLDPIVYHTGFAPKRDQYIRYGLHTTVRLDYAGTAVTYRPDQAGYEQLPLGGYCYGDIGWFNRVRRMRCGGR